MHSPEILKFYNTARSPFSKRFGGISEIRNIQQNTALLGRLMRHKPGHGKACRQPCIDLRHCTVIGGGTEIVNKQLMGSHMSVRKLCIRILLGESCGEFAGYALQAITEESVDTSYRVYIEEKSKLHNAADADVAKCMQMIFDGVVYDIGFISDLGGVGTMARNTLGENKSNNYSRLFSRTEKIANNELKKIRETYATLES